MKRGFFSLRRLRWKLTFSYTLVTVVALLFLELLLAGTVVAFLRSDFLPTLVVQQMKDSLVPGLEEPLRETPPDIDRLRDELDILDEEPDMTEAGESQRQYDGTSLGFTNTPDGGALFVLDDERRLLASSPRLGDFPEGETFDLGRVEGLAPLVDAALRGAENSGRLSDNTPEGLLLTVAPIEGEDGRVAGVLVGTLRLPNPTGTVLIVVGSTAVALIIPAAFLGTIFGFFTAWGITRRLRRLVLAAQSWSRGDFSATAKDRSRDELGQLSRELNSMAAELENLIQTRGELATLEARNRFARDLHDSVKQQVFATSLQIAAARAMISRDTNAAESHLAQADELVRGAQKELNALITEMRPAALEGKGLAAALREYVARWSRNAEIPSDFRVRGERATPLEVEQALFRVAQEALANVARHSGAKKAEVDLAYDDGGGTLTLSVADDGRGFVPLHNTGEGFGLQSMRERLAKLGGHVEVESAPGRGTRVTCVCPLADPNVKRDGGRRWKIG